MRPRFKVLDKTFNTRAKDKTSLRKAQQAKERNWVESSEKCYEFKEAPEEEEDDCWDYSEWGPTTGAVTVTNATMGSKGYTVVKAIPTEGPVCIYSPYRYYVRDNATGVSY